MTKESFVKLSIWLVLVCFQRVYAQQNLFNIPAGEITPEGKGFFQHQTNIYSLQELESKNHFVYGLGKGWEGGVNVINLKMNLNGQSAFLTVNDEGLGTPMKPLLLFTTQKMFRLGKKWKTSIGTQAGFNLTGNQGYTQLTHFTYNLWVYEPTKGLRLLAGPYITDHRFVGRNNRVGLQAGFEARVSEKLMLMGDIISGGNATGVSVLGINYSLTKRLQLCLGSLIPNPGSENRAGLVLEVNLLGFDPVH
ncbi:hypothetical protein Q0590_26565 [Rhodocytophaga aerolata]|uniref:Transporter n=1 Tax=Rhodocytophaga aerolata TaxID=455078 RepID=A0ABT8RCP2_9BACT|nr:hypothetical protein [Rhodocytophaga aerolata]MDO1449871.1 hypothetical protein [Rhodocytophaga aerolata]